MSAQNYCTFCGEQLILKTLLDKTKEKYCQKCDHVFFDAPLSAVIVAITNGKKILLARNVGWQHPYWGLVAGYVKNGETAEEAAIREVQEEVGLKLDCLKILRTYSKPNTDKRSNLLMIGFTAETKKTRIRKCKELEKAAWFSLDKPLPMRSTAIATQIVREVYPMAKLINLRAGANQVRTQVAKKRTLTRK